MIELGPPDTIWKNEVLVNDFLRADGQKLDGTCSGDSELTNNCGLEANKNAHFDGLVIVKGGLQLGTNSSTPWTPQCVIMQRN